MKKRIVVVVVVLLSLAIAVNVFCEEKLPTKTMFISQSCTESMLWVTLLDLKTNEMIIAIYTSNYDHRMLLKQVIYTQTYIDPTTILISKGKN